MKTQITIAAIVLLAFASIAAAPSPKSKSISPTFNTSITKQTFAGFAFFRTHRQGKGATSTWGMNSEAGVSGYILQRTYEDPNDPYANWMDIYVTPCNASRSYKWTDENVFAGFISYRVVAMMSGAATIVSDVNTLHIVGH